MMRLERKDSGQPSALTAIGTITINMISATRPGQIVLLRLMRTLHALELTAQWMWPDARDRFDHAGSVCPLRPLPWIFFLPTIVLMRLCRMWYGDRVVGRLQSMQRRLRVVRYEGLRKLSHAQRNVLQRCLGAIGWSSSLEQLDRSTIEADVDDVDSLQTERHNEGIEDLMERQFNSDGETSDSSYHLPSDVPSSEMSDGDSEAETDKDGATSDSDLQEYVERQRRAKDIKKRQQHQHQPPAQKSNGHHNGQHQQPSLTNGTTETRHQQNESTSGVESMDAQPFCGTGAVLRQRPLPEAMADQASASKTKASTAMQTMPDKQFGTPHRSVQVLHPGTPDTPTITLVDIDEGNDRHNSIMLTQSAILSDSVSLRSDSASNCSSVADVSGGNATALRSIENLSANGMDVGGDGGDGTTTDGLAGFSEPEMSKSKRRRLKKKMQHQQQHHQQPPQHQPQFATLIDLGAEDKEN